jgi:FMN-dependent NADH-azoreductase
MSNILLVLSSPRGEASYSTKVAKRLVDRLQAAGPAATVTVRDLAAEPLPHIGAHFVSGTRAPSETPSAGQRVAVTCSDALIDEVFAADTIVIASAMINFGLTSTLKSWIDHIARGGKTFRYTADGKPEGLLKGKKAYIVESRGGIYSQGGAKALDFQEPYLRHILGFLGITDVEVIDIEGVAFGPEAAQRAVDAALARADALTRSAAA